MVAAMLLLLLLLLNTNLIVHVFLLLLLLLLAAAAAGGVRYAISAANIRLCLQSRLGSPRTWICLSTQAKRCERFFRVPAMSCHKSNHPLIYSELTELAPIPLYA